VPVPLLPLLPSPLAAPRPNLPKSRKARIIAAPEEMAIAPFAAVAVVICGAVAH